jgi:2-polyprenyl-6-methoxyphenol hydroxylase-like FAD-dependent oxidoreductase
MTEPVDCDVAIVGAGPVGLVLATLLGQRGHSVIVLERWPEPYALPRAVHFDHEVGRILQSCGIGDEVRAASEPAEIYEWRNGAGTTLLRFGRIGLSRSGWPESSMFCQPEVESLLDARAQSLPTVEVRRGVEITAVQQHSDHVVIGGAVGNELRARYVVGCDGANSTVRTLAGLAVHDLGFFYDWLIVDVTLDEPRTYDPINLQVCDPVRPTTAVSGGPGRRRWEFMRLPDEPLDELNSEARAWELLAPWDVHPGNARLERHAVYTFQARYAEQWRSGRVFLAGDAAHQMPPFAGQGMCSGIRDAANLAWKLDLVLDGHVAHDAIEPLFDSYVAERLPSARQAINLSMELGKVICVPDPVEAAMRDEAMAAAVTGEISEIPDLPGIDGGYIHPDAAHAGRLFGQPTVDGRLLDDVHGAGWRLVHLTGDDTSTGTSADPEIAAWLRSIGGTIVGLRPDPTDTWLTSLGATWFLQRPDFQLYGTATDIVGAADLLAHLRDRLSAGATSEGAPS